LIQKAIAANSGQFAPDVATDIRRSKGAFFDANERIYAGYLQNVISFGKLRLQTGVRFDAADTNFLANKIVTSDPNDPTVTLRPTLESPRIRKVRVTSMLCPACRLNIS